MRPSADEAAARRCDDKPQQPGGRIAFGAGQGFLARHCTGIVQHEDALSVFGMSVLAVDALPSASQSQQRPAVSVILPVKGCHAHSFQVWRSQLGLQYGMRAALSTTVAMNFGQMPYAVTHTLARENSQPQC